MVLKHPAPSAFRAFSVFRRHTPIPTRTELFGFDSRFASYDIPFSEALGGELNTRLKDWDRLADEQRSTSSEINRRIDQLNDASIPRESRRDASPRQYSPDTAADEPSAAEQYYRDQQKPYVPYFRDSPPPPRPTHSIGTGYY